MGVHTFSLGLLALLSKGTVKARAMVVLIGAGRGARDDVFVPVIVTTPPEARVEAAAFRRKCL